MGGNDPDLRTSIVIAAAAPRIFDLVAPVENWATLLPHYRKVTIVRDGTDDKLANMAAWRGWIPVSWQSIVTAEPARPTITFTHTAGFTRGMTVDWRFEPLSINPDQTRVTIVHHTATIPGRFRRWTIQLFVGQLFIDPIARKTLARFKELAEST